MRAVIVEDQALLREVMVDALTGRGVEVVGQAGNGTEALNAVDEVAPDIAILDIRLPPSYTDEGIRIAESIRSRYPEVGLLVLSSYAEIAYATRLLSIEASSRAVGYLLKDRVGHLADLVEAMGRVVAGEVVIDSGIIDQLMSRRQAGDPLERLTAHERRVLALVAEGRSNLGIAQRLGCRITTVEKHLTVITDKLGLPSSGDSERPGVNVRVLAALTFLRQLDSVV
jgi:DNA-binding NarL/FixJ family response regulator